MMDKAIDGKTAIGAANARAVRPKELSLDDSNPILSPIILASDETNSNDVEEFFLSSSGETDRRFSIDAAKEEEVLRFIKVPGLKVEKVEPLEVNVDQMASSPVTPTGGEQFHLPFAVKMTTPVNADNPYSQVLKHSALNRRGGDFFGSDFAICKTTDVAQESEDESDVRNFRGARSAPELASAKELFYTRTCPDLAEIMPVNEVKRKPKTYKGRLGKVFLSPLSTVGPVSPRLAMGLISPRLSKETAADQAMKKAFDNN